MTHFHFFSRLFSIVLWRNELKRTSYLALDVC
jgi:hypothetical protein